MSIKLTVSCTALQVGDRMDSDNFKSIATIEIRGDVNLKGYCVRGQYNARTNTFHPDILGDPYELEDYYDDIQLAVENRNL